jgi:protein TonB
MMPINRLLGTPTLFKAIACSLVLHTGAISAVYFWPVESIERFSVAGQRQAIYVEASYAENRPREPLEVQPPEPPVPEPPTEVEPREPVKEPAQVPAPVEAIVPVERTEPIEVARITPRELPLKRSESVVETRRPSGSEVDRPVVELAELPPPASNTAKPQPQPSESQAQPTEVPVAVPRQVTEPPLPPSVIAIQQIAGVEDRSPPDFAGNRPPAYPAEAIRRRLEGTVLLRLHITDAGQVHLVEISKSSGHPVLDRAAVTAIRTWRGQPAQQAGQAVATIEVLPIRFRLRN